MGKTIDEFRYTLNFRNIAGSSRSFGDLAAQRDLLVGEAWRMAVVLGHAAKALEIIGDEGAASDVRLFAEDYVGKLEADVMAIDRFLASRDKD